MKKLLGILVVFLAACLILGSCFVETPPPDLNVNKTPIGVPAYNGTVTGTAAGFQGGEVKVELTLKEGIIEDAKVTGQGQTPEYGGKAMTQAQTTILATNSIDGFDGLSGATMTSNAIKDAYKDALSTIPGSGQ